MVEQTSPSQTIDKALKVLQEAEQQVLIDKFQHHSADQQLHMAYQVIHLEKVTPGGLKDYVMRARRFLEDSKNNVNPFEFYKPEVPQGMFLQPGTGEFDDMESLGYQELPKLGLVLIAGGLGERLGYSGIKIDLPVCTIEDSDYCYLKYYIQYVHAIKQRALEILDQNQSKADFYVPLCIMVSDDTYSRTAALLEQNNYFGMKREHVDIVKQENVPALLDNNGNIALHDLEFKIITKPHGHGDIHTLLYQNGIAKKWQGIGKEWMIFLQDTNALALKTIPSVLGVSKKFNFEMNTVTVPRKPGEAMGAICRLIDEREQGKEIVINVEYNQLDSLLRAKWDKGSDVANEIGNSYFPGNTNTLVYKINEYVENLDKTKGVIPEFVNPKYADESRTLFKAPTRLECMMQDYPKLLTSKGAVGFTSYESWYCMSPAKNNLKDAAVCVSKGLPSYGPSEAEYDFYNWTNFMLAKAGVQIQRQDEVTDYQGIKLAFGPKILLDPTFAITFQEIKNKFKGQNKISKDSTVILQGKDTNVNSANIDGYVSTQNGDTVTGNVFNFQNVTFLPLQNTNENVNEIYRIRGYKPYHPKKDGSEEKYLEVMNKILPSIIPDNPDYKVQVEEAIKDFVGNFVGDNKTDLIVQMLLELPIGQICEMLQNYGVFQLKVKEAKIKSKQN